MTKSKIKITYAVIVAALAVALSSSSITPALAANPHFIRSVSNASIDSDGNLVCNFKEAGLGNNERVTIECDGQASLLFACQNGGGNFPKDPKKQTTTREVVGSNTFEADDNGNVVGSVTARLPPMSPPPLDCPGGQQPVLVSISYRDIDLTDTTNGLTIPLRDVSVVFFPKCRCF